MTKYILVISIITTQLIWNISDQLVRESWMTEEQSEQDFGKESTKKEKEINLSSFFSEDIRCTPLACNKEVASISFPVKHSLVDRKFLSIPFLKVPLYILQSCIRI